MYAPGDRWIRNDGVFDLVRADADGYLFASGPGTEVHLTRTLGLARISAAGSSQFEFSPPMELVWPLEVGRGGNVIGTVTFPYLESFPAELVWQVEAVEPTTVPAGTFSAFRIEVMIIPRLSTNFSSQARGVARPGARRFQLWYAPEVRRFVRLEGGPWQLKFELVAADPAETAPLRIDIESPVDQAHLEPDAVATLKGKVSSSRGVSRVVVSLNGQEAKRLEGRQARRVVLLEAEVPLREGKNVLLVTATDADGGTAQEARSLTHVAPEAVSLASVGQTVRVSRQHVVLSGRVESAARAGWFRLTVGEEEILQSWLGERPSSFAVPVKLAPGPNVVRTWVSDPDGAQRVVDERVIVFDAEV